MLRNSRNGATCHCWLLPSRVQVIVVSIAAVALTSFCGLWAVHRHPSSGYKAAALLRPAAVMVVSPSLYEGPIYTDFYQSSDRFAYVNYKSTESVLQVYPLASVVALIVGPRQVDYYHVADNLAKHQFLPYQKRGYRIAAVAQHDRSLNKLIANTTSGHAYFARAFARCCVVTRAVDMRAVTRAPLALLWYVRLLHLHHGGGLAADASWLHVRPLPLGDVDGWAVRTGCGGLNGTAGADVRCGVSSLLVFRRGSPVPGCVLQHFDDPVFLACIDGADDGRAQVSTAADGDERARFARDRRHVRCFEDALARCAGSRGITNALANAALVADDPVAAVVPGAGPAVVWLGPMSWAGDWRYLSPADGSIQTTTTFTSPTSAALTALVARVRLWRRGDLEAGARVRCRSNSSAGPALPCSRYHVYTSPSSTPYTPSEVAQARLSCAPTFLLAGFMKAGTTALYGSLANHPQVLRNLQGVGFKESGAYMPLRRETAARMRAFPYVAPADGTAPFAYGDATVYTSGQMDTPHHMLRDNPRMKAVFAVRDPVQRLLSHHRFVRRYAAQDVNVLVARVLGSGGSGAALGQLRALVTQALAAAADSAARRAALGAAVESYYHGLRARGVGAGLHTGEGSLITWSLYALPVHHFMAVLGRGNVLVMQSERLAYTMNHNHGEAAWANITGRRAATSTTEVEAQFNRLYAFLGLCALDKTKRGFEYKSKDNVAPAHRLNRSMDARLRVFFEPFNRLLDELVGEAFGY